VGWGTIRFSRSESEGHGKPQRVGVVREEVPAPTRLGLPAGEFACRAASSDMWRRTVLQSLVVQLVPREGALGKVTVHSPALASAVGDTINVDAGGGQMTYGNGRTGRGDFRMPTLKLFQSTA